MKEALHYLIELIKWRFSPKSCIGLMFYYHGKLRVVTGETFQYFYIGDCKKGFLKSDYVLNNDKYIVLNCQKNGKYQEN